MSWCCCAGASAATARTGRSGCGQTTAPGDSTFSSMSWSATARAPAGCRRRSASRSPRGRCCAVAGSVSALPTGRRACGAGCAGGWNGWSGCRARTARWSLSPSETCCATTRSLIRAGARAALTFCLPTCPRGSQARIWLCSIRRACWYRSPAASAPFPRSARRSRSGRPSRTRPLAR